MQRSPPSLFIELVHPSHVPSSLESSINPIGELKLCKIQGGPSILKPVIFLNKKRGKKMLSYSEGCCFFFVLVYRGHYGLEHSCLKGID